MPTNLNKILYTRRQVGPKLSNQRKKIRHQIMVPDLNDTRIRNRRHKMRKMESIYGAVF